MHRLRTVTLAALGAFGLLIALSAAASAHVTVTSPGATSGGGDQEITFRVPVEENANTIGLVIQLPTATPIASVDVLPVPGWTHTQVVAKLATPIKTDDGDITDAVSQITWTAAAGGGLKPGEFGEFTIIAGQLPDVKSLTFKAIQTYSNGSVVRWIETPAPGSTEEPEHPAPVLQLAAADSSTDASDSGSASATPTVSASPQASSGHSDGDSNTGPVVLSIIALVIAAAALGLAVVSRASGRSTT